MIDTICVAIGALGESYGRMVVNHVRLQEGGRKTTVWGTPLRTTPPMAAFANASLAHGLDFDDMLKPMIGHPSATVVPAAFALAEARSLDGRSLLEGCIAGLEVAGRLGELLNVGLYRKGWHPTAALGTVAAAAAAGRMIGLDPGATTRALGIASTFASGLRSSFGTPVKGLQVGNAARCGVEAALLAEAGCPAHPDGMERRFGFYELFSEDGCSHRDGAPAGKGGVAGTLAHYGLGYKRYPCCGRIQPATDTLLWLRRKHNLSSADVSAIRCGSYEMALRTLSFTRPTNGYEARYSMHYCLATALEYGDLSLVHFHDERMADPAIRALIDRMEFAVDPSLPETEKFPSRLTLTLRDGQELTALGFRGAGSGTVVVAGAGEEELPITEAGLRQKWQGCLEAAGVPEGALDRLIGAIYDLENAKDLGRMIAAISVKALG